MNSFLGVGRVHNLVPEIHEVVLQLIIDIFMLGLVVDFVLVKILRFNAVNFCKIDLMDNFDAQVFLLLSRNLTGTTPPKFLAPLSYVNYHF